MEGQRRALPGSALVSSAGCGVSPQQSLNPSSRSRDAIASTRASALPRAICAIGPRSPKIRAVRGSFLLMRPRALLYRPVSQWTMWAGLSCAAAIFAVAICLGRTSVEPSIALDLPGDSVTVEFLEPEPEPMPAPDEQEITPPAPATPEEAFPEETAEPRKAVSKRMRPVVRQVPRKSTPGTSSNSGGANTALYAPRPDYPYEARRQNATGTGLVGLTIDPASGSVVSVQMKRTTGRAILDASALKTLALWKFRRGSSRLVDIPITFTLTGASY